MTEDQDYVSARLARRLSELGASMEEKWAAQELEGTKYTSGWDESFGFSMPDGSVIGIGPGGELSSKYASASNEFWAGHSSSLEARVELENFLCNPRIRQGAPTSMWDVVQRTLFHGPQSNISAHVGGVMDEDLRLQTPWVMRELPDLLTKSAVKKIHLIDDITGHVTTVDRKEAMAHFNSLMSDDHETRAGEALYEHQLSLVPEMQELEEALASATEYEKPWLQAALDNYHLELAMSARDYALRQFAGDLDGARVYIARQDLEGDFTRPEQPEELRKYQLSIDLQNQGALITTLEAPRHGLSFDELKERTDFQAEISALKHSINRDVEIINARVEALAGLDKEEVREQRNELATAFRSIRKETAAFTELIALSEQAQIGLDLERRLVLAEAINTDTALGHHLQEDAYLSSEIQTLSDQVRAYERAAKEGTSGQAREGELDALHAKIREVREQLTAHGSEIVPLDDLDPKLRARYENSKLAQQHSLEVHDALEKYFKQWREERGILQFETTVGEPAHLQYQERPIKLRESLLKITDDNDSRVKVDDPAKADTVLPPLNASQRKKFAQNMHVAINEVVGTVILTVLPAASAAVDTGLAIRDANTMVQSKKKAKDEDASPLERLEAEFESKMAKWHVVQQTVSAGVALIPLVGVPATMAIGLANLVFDCVEGAKLEKVKDNLKDLEEPPVWRKASERRPHPTVSIKETREKAEEERLLHGRDRGFTAFTKEGWASLIKEKEEKSAGKAVAEEEKVRL